MHRYANVGRCARLLRVFGESSRAVSFCICAVIETKSGSGFRITRAPLCSSRISGRMFRAICEKGRIYIPLEAFAEHGLTEDGHRRAAIRSALRRADEILIARHARNFCRRLPLAEQRRRHTANRSRTFQPRRIAILDAIEARATTRSNIGPRSTKCTQAAVARPRARSNIFTRTGLPADRAELPCGASSSAEIDGRAQRTRRLRRIERVAHPTRNATASRARQQQFLSGFLRLAKAKTQCALRVVCFHATGGQCFRRARRSRNPNAAVLRAGAACSMKPSPGRRRPSDSSGVGRHHRAFDIPTRYFHDLILGAEMDLTVDFVRNVRSPVRILLSCCWHGRADVPARVWIPRSARSGPRRAPRNGLSTDEYSPRRPQRSWKWAASTCRRRICERFGCSREDLRGPLTPPLRACSNSKRIAPGDFTPKARALVHRWMRTAAQHFGRCRALTARCCAHRRARISTCSRRVFRFRAPKKSNIS